MLLFRCTTAFIIAEKRRIRNHLLFDFTADKFHCQFSRKKRKRRNAPKLHQSILGRCRLFCLLIFSVHEITERPGSLPYYKDHRKANASSLYKSRKANTSSFLTVLIKGWIERVEVLRIQVILNQPQALTKSLIMDYLTFS